MQILRIQFPQSKRINQSIQYSPVDTYIDSTYRNRAWYCEPSYSIYLFSEESKNELQETLDKGTPKDLDGYEVQEVNLAIDHMESDTREWIQKQIDAMNKIKEVLGKFKDK